jgi:hypothetical protein
VDGADSAFEVAIGPSGTPGRFKVEVIRSRAGETSALAELDVAGLLAQRPEVQYTLIASAGPRPLSAPLRQPVIELGETLFQALLGTGPVLGQYRAAAAIAATREQRLRVVVRIDTPELAGLPWEAMYDREAGAHLCLRGPLVRHVPVASVPAPLTVQVPLRILGVVSSPRGEAELDTGREREQLTRALAGPISAGQVEVTWAPSATWEDLQDELLR